MNALTHTLRRPGRRIAELDPFATGTESGTDTSYGCVDWYVYGEEESTAVARTGKAPPRSATTGLPLVLPLEPQARTQRH